MTKFILCHHAERADRRPAWEESEKYPGITKKGEEETREKTKVLAKVICDLPGDSVVVLGGCSKAIRTKSTLIVHTDELRRILQGEKEVLFSKPFNSVSPLDALKEISMESDSINRATKVIVDFPLLTEEFIALRGQKESAMARRMINGLNGQVGFFRRFFPKSHMVLVNSVHAPETSALINFLQKTNGSCALASIVNFM